MMSYINMAGLEALRAKLAAAGAALPALLAERSINVVADMVEELADAAPIGETIGGGTPPGDDAEGALFESFSFEFLGAGSTLVVAQVRTNQPTKLRFVRYGTGIFGPIGQRIYPVHARALYWPTAPNPFASVAGQQPNDFVAPIVRGAVISADAEMLLMQREFAASLAL